MNLQATEEPKANELVPQATNSSEASESASVTAASARPEHDHRGPQLGFGNAAVCRAIEQPEAGFARDRDADIPFNYENAPFLQRKIGNQGTAALLLRKARVSQPDDEYEREADQVARQIVRSDESDSEQGSNTVSNVTPVFDAKATGIGGGGESLANSTRGFFEPRFGKDLGAVRVHSDAEAARSAWALNARAFTLGPDIFFGAGEYAPETGNGKDLLAHELTHVMQQSSAGAAHSIGGATIQRSVSPHYSSMVNNLSYGVLDWAVTEAEAKEVLDWLAPLSSDDLGDTVLKLESDGYLNRLLDNISGPDRTSYAALIQKIHRTRNISRTSAKIESLLSYGILDWAITDEEAHEVLVNIQNMPAERRRVLVFQLVEHGYYDRLINNVSSADSGSFATLLAELSQIRDDYRDRMLRTGVAGPSARQDVEAELTPGVVRNPLTRVPDPFVDPVAGKTYRQDLEKKLDDVRAWMFPQHQALLARTKLPMTRFEGIGEEAKRQTDTLFGRYANGPALRAGTRAAGANLIDRSLETPDPAELVNYLIHNQGEVLPVHALHTAVPSRPTEKGIIDQLIIDYSAAHTAELEVMDRGWPAVEEIGTKIVQIQPFEGTTPSNTRTAFWKSFQTLIHEYLHTITHPNYTLVAGTLGSQEDSVLTEGGTSLFTDDVWNVIFPAEIRANDTLRANVEGSTMPFDASVIPPISHYDQIAQARNIRSRVGEENMRAAYFLGHTELIGLGPTWTPTGAARGSIFVVPASGISTVADVAVATGASPAAVAAANGKAITDPVTPGQELTVPGIRIHTVISGGTETKATIADLNGVTEGQLDRANPGVNWAALTAGQRVVIPLH